MKSVDYIGHHGDFELSGRMGSDLGFWDVVELGSRLRQPEHPLTVTVGRACLPHPPRWMERAACSGSTVNFFGCETLAPRQVCQRCPVRQDCLDYALDHDMVDGVWGGTTARERRRLPRSREATGVVYFAIGDELLVKIGCTEHVKNRMRVLGGLTLLATEPGMHRREGQLHARFAHLRAHGEFFHGGPDLLAYIDALPGRVRRATPDAERRAS